MNPCFRRRVLPALAACALAACSVPPRPLPAPPPPGAPTSASVLAADARGYLAAAALPDGQRLLPPPPAAGSTALAQDAAVARDLQALRGGPRWQQARRDADLNFPAAAAAFSCTLGVAVDAAGTPRLYRLLERSMHDASDSTAAAKARYQRPRPFAVNGQPTCTPEDDKALRGNGAYPSGHTAIGWSWAMILAELAPERGDALLLRGRRFGESRLVCNVHWQSDVLQGRVMGAATVAALHADAGFRADLEAARRGGAEPDAAGCAAEAAALATPLPGVL